MRKPPTLLWMLVLLVAATKILAVNAGTSIDQASHLNCWPAYLVLCLIITLLLSWIFLNQYALSNLLLLDIYDRIADDSTNIKQRAKLPTPGSYMDLGKG